MPLQMILLALLALVTAESLPPALPPWPAPPTILALVVGSYAVLILGVALATRRVVRRLHASAGAASDLTHRVHRIMDWARWGSLALLGVHLWLGGWGWLVLFDWGLKAHQVAAGFLLIMPVVGAFLSFWTCGYYIERAVRERSLAFALQMGQATHPMPPLPAYLLMQARHNFYLLLIIAFKGIIDRVALEEVWARAHPVLAWGVLGAVPLLLFVITPWIIVNMWHTVPLPDPPAGRLSAVARQYRIRFTRILLWHTHHTMPNAAILGPVPLVRYFLMTDALLECLSDRQIEAVFAHEIGHGYHKHMWWYLAFMLGTITGAAAGADLAGLAWPALRGDAANQIISFGLLALGLGGGFSFVSHRFEHQADWFAARHMARSLARTPEWQVNPMAVEAYIAGSAIPGGVALLTPDRLDRVPSADSLPPDAGAAPPAVPVAALAKGAEIFGSSLRQLVELSHRSLNKRGWLHPSVNQRLALVQCLAESPAAAEAFDRMERRLRWAIVAFVALGLTLAELAWVMVPPGK